jgi:hypothetical protein
MFKDKKLRNTFWTAGMALILPPLFSMLMLFIGADALALLSTTIAIPATIVSIYVLVQFIKNWKKWPQRPIKIIGIIIASLGIILHPTILFMVYEFLEHFI